MGREPNRTSDILEAVALLVVDMQDSFLNVINDSAATVDRCAFAIETARAFGLKVIFTEQVPAKLGPTSPRLTALAPDARIFAKNSFSALQADGLLEYLRKIGVYHLLVAGIETPVCVYQTALHAHDSDLDVTVLSDCVTGRRLDDAIVILEALSKAECHVLPSETVFYSMLGTCLNPRFPAYNSLIKKYSGGTEHAIDDEPVATYAVVERAPPEEVEDPHLAPGGPDDAEPEAFDQESSAEHDESGDDDESDESDDERAPRDEAPAEHRGERTHRDAPAGAGQGDQQQQRKRSRRRRGGARRRKARERAAAGQPGGGTENSPQPGRAAESDSGGARSEDSSAKSD